MKYTSTIIAAGSGSIGGCTYSHNSYGQYIRRRAVPVFPGSTAQLVITGALAQLLTQWRTLTALVQDGWNSYALTVPKTDANGNTYFMTGQAMFVGCNIPRIQTSTTVVTAAPALSGESFMTAANPTSLTASTRVLIETFNNADLWATAVGGKLLVYTSRPKGTNINYFKGPFRLAGTVVGAGTPPTSPQNITTPFTLSAGQKVFVRTRAFNADGRLSNSYQTSIVTI